jgi:hypothetical protein
LEPMFPPNWNQDPSPASLSYSFSGMFLSVSKTT